MCPTWWARHTWPLSHSNWHISITTIAVAAAATLQMPVTPGRNQPWQEKGLVAVMRHQLNCIPARAPHSSRGYGHLALDIMSTSGKSFTTWMGMAVAAGRHFSSAIMPPGTASWWPSGPAWRFAWMGDNEASGVPASGLDRLGDGWARATHPT